MSTYLEFAQDAARRFGLEIARDDGTPRISLAIDNDAPAILDGLDFRIAREDLNPLYVEDLLKNCVDRITTCLELRDRAQELEIRFMTSLMEIDLQRELVRLERSFDGVYDPGLRSMAKSAASFHSAESTSTPMPLPEDFWNNVEEQKQRRADTLLHFLTLRSDQIGEEGNASDFKGRYEFTYKLFKQALDEAYRRALVCQEALRIVYQIDIPLPDPSPAKFLNNLAVWVQDASDNLDRVLDQRVVGELGLAIAAPGAEQASAFYLLSAATFRSQRAANRLTFPVTSSPFQMLGMRDPRLRSFRLQARSRAPVGSSRVWPCQVKLPHDSDLQISAPSVAAIAVDDFREIDNGQAVVRGVHNIDPVGSWEIILQPRALDGTATSSLDNLQLFLRVSYRPG